MIRLCFIALMLLISQPLVAKEEIAIITRNAPSSPSMVTGSVLVKRLNAIQDKYNFTLRSVLGNNGENADQRALALARSGTKVLTFGPIASYTINRYEVGPTFDRDNDFYFIKSFTTTYQSVVTNPDNTSKNANEYFESLKKKDKSFYGITMEAGSSGYLTNILLRHYNITNATKLKYKDFAEINLALMNKEIDFSIYIFPGIGSLKEVLNSSIGINSGKESGIEDFFYENNSSFAIPKEFKEFGLEIKPYFDQLCNDQEINEIVEKYKYKRTCYDDDMMRQKIEKELKMIEKYK